nr:hypothetical protein [uncultured Psychroserpens sp.]
MFKIYIIGICILIIAIVANGLIVKLGLKSWYDFIDLLGQHGWSALKQIGLIDYLWLFIGYPLVLGFGYILGTKLYNLFT